MGISSSSLIDVRMRLSGGAAARKEAAATAASLKGVGTAAKGVGASSVVAAGPRGIQRFQKGLSSLRTAGTKMKSVGSSMSRLTLPMALVGGAAIKMSIDFEREMRNVNSIAQLPEGSFKSLSNSALDIASDTAQMPRTIAEGLYTLVSSGFKAKESLGIIRQAARAATAGLTDTATSTKAVAAVLNSYRMHARKAGAVSDTLFRTVDRGVISFEELAQTLGPVLPFASGLGISLRETGASIATLTKGGIPAAQSLTYIKNVMASLIKPSSDLQSQIRRMGFESGSALVRAKGFQGSLDALAKASGGSKEAMGKLFPNLRALSGALALTGRNSKGAGEDLKGMMGDAGATAIALSQQTKSTSYQWKRLKTDAAVLAIKVGDVLLPVLIGMTNVLGTMVKGFKGLPGPVKTGVLVFVLLLAVIGPLVSGIGSLIIAVVALGNAALWLWANPIGLAIIGVIALGIAFYIAYKKIRLFHDAVDAVSGFIKAHWKTVVMGYFIAPLLIAVWAVKNWRKVLRAALIAVLFPIRMVIEAFKRWREIPGIVGSAVTAIWGVVKTGLGKVLDFIKSMAPKGAAAMKSFASAVVSAIKGLPGMIGSLSFDVGKEIIEGIKAGLGFGNEEILGEVTMTPRFRAQARGMGNRSVFPKSNTPRMGRAGSSRAPLTRPRIRMPSAGSSALTFERSPIIQLNATIRNELDGKEISRNTTKHVLDAEARS